MITSKVSSYLLTGLLTIGIYSFPLEKSQAKGNDEESTRSFVSYNAPDTLSYDELVKVYESASPPASLLPKINALLTTPFISNEAHFSGPTPELSQDIRLGHFIRAGSWNIQCGLQVEEIKLALSAPEEFMQKIKARPDSDESRKILRELDIFRSVDILILNEVDLSLKRTGYTDVAREIALALKMNYVYGVEFIEIDPLNLGLEEFSDLASDEKRARLQKLIEIDKGRYLGLQGAAILSRFPIRQAKLIPLKYQPYDWYRTERVRVSLPEKMRRQLSRMAFLEKFSRQVRYGGRSVLIAELDIPQLPEGAMTVVATHLENRCGPLERRRQMREVLSIIRDIKGPLVLAGDLNTSGSNLKPTTVSRELKNRIRDKKFWAKQLVKMLVPIGSSFDITLEVVNFARIAHDPTARGVFLFGQNKEAHLFKDLEAMRFTDGYAFDFRGDSRRTVNCTKGTLANSNQRSGKKGFITTHAMRRTYWAVGKNKLDWMFVKAYARNPRDSSEPYRMAPHFARTLERLNYSLSRRLSDHNPVTVDLPLDEPNPQKLSDP